MATIVLLDQQYMSGVKGLLRAEKVSYDLAAVLF